MQRSLSAGRIPARRSCLGRELPKQIEVLIVFDAFAGLFEGFADFPITRDQISMLMEGNTCDSSRVFEHFAIQPTPFTVQALDYLNRSARA